MQTRNGVRGKSGTILQTRNEVRGKSGTILQTRNGVRGKSGTILQTRNGVRSGVKYNDGNYSKDRNYSRAAKMNNGEYWNVMSNATRYDFDRFK